MKKIVAILLSFLLAGVLAACGNGDASFSFEEADRPATTAPTEGENRPATTAPSESSAPAESLTEPAAVPEFTVRKADWTDIEWESYSNPYFTLTIPKGWKVEWQGNAQQLNWNCSLAEAKVGLSNLDHNYAAKDASMCQALNMRYYLANGTVEEYFKTAYAGSTEYFNVMNSCVPSNKDELQKARPNTAIRDYRALYVQFRENGWDGEGIYSAAVMESPDVVIRGLNYGVWEINCTFTEWAPRGELVNWIPVLSKIAQSFAYTDYYVQEWLSVLSTASYNSPTSSVNDTDPVMEAFEERSRSDTIIQEKRSDEIEDYERVYDNETGEYYRAYEGFLDDVGDEQTRYRAVTDDEYANGYSGWIDR